MRTIPPLRAVPFVGLLREQVFCTIHACCACHVACVASVPRVFATFDAFFRFLAMPQFSRGQKAEKRFERVEKPTETFA